MSGNLQAARGARAVYLLAADGTPIFSTQVPAADNLLNPTAPQVLAHGLAWDVTNSVWRRVRATPGGVLMVAPLSGNIGVDGVVGGAYAYDRDANIAYQGVTPAIYNGTAWDAQRTPAVFKVVALGAATAETTIWTPAASKKFRLMGFLLTCGAASTLTFKDGTGLATIFAARGGLDVPISLPNLGNGILSGAANRVLTVTRGTSCTLDGVVWGTEE